MVTMIPEVAHIVSPSDPWVATFVEMTKGEGEGRTSRAFRAAWYGRARRIDPRQQKIVARYDPVQD